MIFGALCLSEYIDGRDDFAWDVVIKSGAEIFDGGGDRESF